MAALLKKVETQVLLSVLLTLSMEMECYVTFQSVIYQLVEMLKRQSDLYRHSSTPTSMVRFAQHSGLLVKQL